MLTAVNMGRDADTTAAVAGALAVATARRQRRSRPHWAAAVALARGHLLARRCAGYHVLDLAEPAHPARPRPGGDPPMTRPRRGPDCVRGPGRRTGPRREPAPAVPTTAAYTGVPAAAPPSAPACGAGRAANRDDVAASGAHG
ncbi:hypothetical protein SCALM49S_08771 [Streptomyces californicus]